MLIAFIIALNALVTCWWWGRPSRGLPWSGWISSLCLLKERELAAFGPSLAQASELHQWIFQREAEGVSRPKAKLPEYKHYTGLLHTLLELARQSGGSIQAPLKRLRQRLQEDAQFERKRRGLIMGCLLQFALIVLVVNGMIWVTSETFGLAMPLAIRVLVWGMQGLGMGLFFWSLGWLERWHLRPLEEWQKGLIAFESLLGAPLPAAQILERSGLARLLGPGQKPPRGLEDFVALLRLRLAGWRQGAPFAEALAYLLEELSDRHRQSFEAYLTHLSGVKLGVLALFFLGSYLLFMASLLQTVAFN